MIGWAVSLEVIRDYNVLVKLQLIWLAYESIPLERSCQMPRFLEGWLHCLHNWLGSFMVCWLDLEGQKECEEDKHPQRHTSRVWVKRYSCWNPDKEGAEGTQREREEADKQQEREEARRSEDTQQEDVSQIVKTQYLEKDKELTEVKMKWTPWMVAKKLLSANACTRKDM